MKRSRALLIVTTALTAALPAPVSAQDTKDRLIPAAIGGVLGTGAGGYMALSIVALRARRGQYLFNLADAFGWESAAVLAGGGTGIIVGAWDKNRLRNTVVSSAALGLVGTGIGILVGQEKWPPPEGRWAGGVIGGGAGILAGAIVGVLMPPDFLFEEEDEGVPGVPLVIRIPVGP